MINIGVNKMVKYVYIVRYGKGIEKVISSKKKAIDWVKTKLTQDYNVKEEDIKELDLMGKPFSHNIGFCGIFRLYNQPQYRDYIIEKWVLD